MKLRTLVLGVVLAGVIVPGASAHWPKNERCSSHMPAKVELRCGYRAMHHARAVLRWWDTVPRSAQNKAVIHSHRWLYRYGRLHIRYARARMRPQGRRVRVVATCYDLSGTTATGAPVGWGVVAVDPSFIPLHSRLDIPGYSSNARALDTGSAVRGAHIDLWKPSCSGWPNPYLTITVY